MQCSKARANNLNRGSWHGNCSVARHVPDQRSCQLFTCTPVQYCKPVHCKPVQYCKPVQVQLCAVLDLCTVCQKAIVQKVQIMQIMQTK